jgi:hypothetical protein
MKLLLDEMLSGVSGGETSDIKPAMQQLVLGAAPADGLNPNATVQSAGFDNIGDYVNFWRNYQPTL